MTAYCCVPAVSTFKCLSSYLIIIQNVNKMKAILLMAAVVLLAVSACKGQITNAKKQTIVTEPDKDLTMAGDNHTNTTIENQDSSQLKAVFDNYFALKDALVKTNGVTASAKASAMLLALNAIKMETLKMEEHTVWMKVEKDLKFDATHIAETKDASHQREHFMALSKNMYELIKVSTSAETVYYQFCPMYNDGKGANWLSRESAIKNPYYGSQMLTCGKTVETIAH